jgi:DNA-directed RNA polymerase subunit E'/Rpb7
MHGKMSLITYSNIPETISISYADIPNDINSYFINYAKKQIEGRCRKEGYIYPNTLSIQSYSTGILFGDRVKYDVVFSGQVCNPETNMNVDCKIINITKIGIRAIISDVNNPMILFISREHNQTKDFDDYSVNQIINVRILGTRFEIYDTYISVIAEIN